MFFQESWVSKGANIASWTRLFGDSIHYVLRRRNQQMGLRRETMGTGNLRVLRNNNPRKRTLSPAFRISALRHRPSLGRAQRRTSDALPAKLRSRNLLWESSVHLDACRSDLDCS